MDTNNPTAAIAEQAPYRSHLRHEIRPTVPTLVLKNLSSFLPSCHECANQSPNRRSLSSRVHSPHAFSSNRSPELLRMKAGELIEQEKCDSNFAYCVDQPSRLVRIECLKAGCKCVLKQEPTLALKIVCGVSLVRCTWSTLGEQQNSHGSHHNPRWTSFSSAFERRQSSRVPTTSCQSSQCQTPLDQSSASNSNFKDQIPLIFTSCSPFWFEILKQRNDTFHGQDVPSWSSGKALWKSRPSMFLLRKQTKCILSVSSGVPRGPVTLDLDNVVHLHPGTVLRLIDCKSCRLVSKNNPQCLPVSSLLQCEIVGSKSLSKYASSANNIPPDNALYWFAGGPRLVYLPLDDKTVSFYPIATPPSNSRDSKDSGWVYSGAHSVLTLLSHFPLPLTVRPVMEHSLAREGNASLNLVSCYHGDLVFLEPIANCGPVEAGNNSSNSASMAGENSRFFVVTAEMLSQHRFVLATPQSSQLHSRELKTHASRVAHFLAAFHPAFGLNYLLKYLEDVTHCSSVGPPHRPLTETLGLLNGEVTVASHTATASIPSSALLHLDIEEGSDPADLHAVYDDLDDIYQYVRTGHLPSKQSGITPSSGMLRSYSAGLRTKIRRDYTIPYVFFPDSSFHSSSDAPFGQQQLPPPPPPLPRRHVATPIHTYAYPSPSKFALRSDVPSPLPLPSPNRRQQAYGDCTRFRPVEQPPTSHSILNFANINERTTSSPDTGLGGDSGPSLVVPKATTSIVRSSCHQLINFCENGVTNDNEAVNSMRLVKSSRLLYPNLRRLTVNLHKRIL